MAHWKKLALVSGVAVAGGIIGFVTGGTAAPIVGALIGKAMGLSGAAATSAGLAALGGGALASGGGGMALGTMVVSGATAVVGAGGAGALASTVPVERRCRGCDALVEQRDAACGNCGAKLD
jgi:hypothetical protein